MEKGERVQYGSFQVAMMIHFVVMSDGRITIISFELRTLAGMNNPLPFGRHGYLLNNKQKLMYI